MTGKAAGPASVAMMSVFKGDPFRPRVIFGRIVWFR
jgi:hypothetical protein